MGPLMQTLHVQPRRASAQNIDRSVVICMRSEAACAAAESRLVLARFAVHGSAGRAGLRCVGGIDQVQRPAAFFQLVGQKCFELAPSLVENGAVKSCLLTHVLAWSLNGSGRAGGHVLDLQLLQRHGAEPARNVSRNAMIEVDRQERGC